MIKLIINAALPTIQPNRKMQYKYVNMHNKTKQRNLYVAQMKIDINV